MHFKDTMRCHFYLLEYKPKTNKQTKSTDISIGKDLEELYSHTVLIKNIIYRIMYDTYVDSVINYLFTHTHTGIIQQEKMYYRIYDPV